MLGEIQEETQIGTGWNSPRRFHQDFSAQQGKMPKEHYWCWYMSKSVCVCVCVCMFVCTHQSSERPKTHPCSAFHSLRTQISEVARCLFWPLWECYKMQISCCWVALPTTNLVVSPSSVLCEGPGEALHWAECKNSPEADCRSVAIGNTFFFLGTAASPAVVVYYLEQWVSYWAISSTVFSGLFLFASLPQKRKESNKINFDLQSKFQFFSYSWVVI